MAKGKGKGRGKKAVPVPSVYYPFPVSVEDTPMMPAAERVGVAAHRREWAPDAHGAGTR